MKRIEINTAKQFSDDYTKYSFYSNNEEWIEEKNQKDLQVINQFNNKFENNTLIQNIRSRNRRLVIWIEKDDQLKKNIFSLSATRITSSNRRDFTNRTIFDGINFSIIEDFAFSDRFYSEAISISESVLDKYFYKILSLDSFASLSKFNSDKFPFDDINSIWTYFAGDKSLSPAVNTAKFGSDVFNEFIKNILKDCGINYKLSMNNSLNKKNPRDRKDSLLDLSNKTKEVIDSGALEIFGENRKLRKIKKFTSIANKLTNTFLEKGVSLLKRVDKNNKSKDIDNLNKIFIYTCSNVDNTSKINKLLRNMFLLSNHIPSFKVCLTLDLESQDLTKSMKDYSLINFKSPSQ